MTIRPVDQPRELRTLGLKSVKSLARILGTTEESLRDLCAHAGGYYAAFPLTTKAPPFPRKPFLPKKRPIDNPVQRLKHIQRLINERLLGQIGFPAHIFGGVKKKTVRENAAQHLSSPVLVTLDIRKFFPSVKTTHVYQIWIETLDCSPEVARLLTQLTTFKFRLPQGAPTSTSLANLVVCRMDTAIRKYCKEAGVIYSTWVDDLAFSGASSREVIDVAVKALSVAGFAVSRNKLKVMSASRRQILTGVLVNKYLGIPKERRSAIRSGINKLACGLVEPAERERYIQTLRSKIAYFKSISPKQASPLETQLSKVLKNLAVQ